MQDPSLYAQIKSQSQSQSQPQFPEQQHLKCPRCDSINTKFCYYNNYNLSQPRYFCKSCRRYWTKGGALRNIPVGGGSRKHTKRSSSSSSSSSSNAIKRSAASNSRNTDAIKTSTNGENPDTLNPLKGENFGGQFGNFLQEGSGSSFTSLLGTGGQFGNFLDGLGPHTASALQINGHFGDPGPGQNVDAAVGNADGFLNIHGGDESGNGNDDGATAACWSGNSNTGWTDLAMFTPSGSNCQ